MPDQYSNIILRGAVEYSFDPEVVFCEVILDHILRR